MIRNHLFAITVASLLAGCATTPERRSEVLVAANSDEHARFEKVRVSSDAGRMQLTGWIRAGASVRKSNAEPGTVHIEIVTRNGGRTYLDAPWRPNRVGTIRRLTPKRLDVQLPSQGEGASLVRVSHGHPGHSDAPGMPR